MDQGAEGPLCFAAPVDGLALSIAPTADLPRRLRAARDALGPGEALVGWLAYEAGRAFERMPAGPPPAAGYGQLWVGRPVEVALPSTPNAVGPAPALGTNATQQAYEAGVAQILAHIRAGDIYQANLAWAAPPTPVADPLALFLALRAANPAERGALLLDGPLALVSNSPELLLAIDRAPDGALHARSVPIKGTVRRDAGPAAAQALWESEKERAELTMIVDLVRNDLGRVARPGSVTVGPRTLRPCGDLLHAEQEVRAILEPDKDAIDALAALFPAGSVTGAPKVRAMEIIRDLEAGPRGAYCGSIGCFGADGSARFNVAIRTITILDGRGHFHVGAGIVADSNPAAEWRETLAKATALWTQLHRSTP